MAMAAAVAQPDQRIQGEGRGRGGGGREAVSFFRKDCGAWRIGVEVSSRAATI